MRPILRNHLSNQTFVKSYEIGIKYLSQNNNSTNTPQFDTDVYVFEFQPSPTLPESDQELAEALRAEVEGELQNPQINLDLNYKNSLELTKFILNMPANSDMQANLLSEYREGIREKDDDCRCSEINKEIKEISLKYLTPGASDKKFIQSEVKVQYYEKSNPSITKELKIVQKATG